jgi:hypothetical protein
MSPTDHDENTSSPEDRHRQAAALNHLLGEIGLSKGEQSQWWNLVAHAELGGRTATQAWLAGDAESVTAIVEQWYAASTEAAGRASHDPEFLAHLRQKLADLDKRVLRGGPLHRSA